MNVLEYEIIVQPEAPHLSGANSQYDESACARQSCLWWQPGCCSLIPELLLLVLPLLATFAKFPRPAGARFLACEGQSQWTLMLADDQE